MSMFLQKYVQFFLTKLFYIYSVRSSVHYILTKIVKVCSKMDLEYVDIFTQ